MHAEIFSDFDFTSPGGKRKRKRSSPSDDIVNVGTRMKQARLDFAAFYRRQNELYRKPCPTCQTLVKPELLHQHYDAYHPNTPMPVTT
jgi:hypothetical protein